MLTEISPYRREVSRCKAQAVHTAIDLEMDREGGDACATRAFAQPLEELHTIDLGLEAVREEGICHRQLGVHNHNVRADALVSQLTSFVRHSYGEVVDAVLLECTRQLEGARPVAIGLDHTDKRMLGRQERAVVIEVVHDSTEVDIQHRLVLTRGETAVDLIEGEAACALDEDARVVQTRQ